MPRRIHSELKPERRRERRAGRVEHVDGNGEPELHRPHTETPIHAEVAADGALVLREAVDHGDPTFERDVKPALTKREAERMVVQDLVRVEVSGAGVAERKGAAIRADASGEKLVADVDVDMRVRRE